MVYHIIVRWPPKEYILERSGAKAFHDDDDSEESAMDEGMYDDIEHDVNDGGHHYHHHIQNNPFFGNGGKYSQSGNEEAEFDESIYEEKISEDNPYADDTEDNVLIPSRIESNKED